MKTSPAFERYFRSTNREHGVTIQCVICHLRESVGKAADGGFEWAMTHLAQEHRSDIKIEIKLSDRTQEMLLNMSDEQDLSQKDIMEDAVKLLNFFLNEKEKGHRVFIVEDDANEAKEIVLI